MSELDMECAKVFLDNQEQLFDEPVALDIDEAMEFLEDCMAVVLEDEDELLQYLKDEGVDISDYDDIKDALEVFALGDGRFLYVEA